MTGTERRMYDDARDWYFTYYKPRLEMEPSKVVEAEHFLARSIEAVMQAERVIPEGITVIRDTPDGPLLKEPYVINSTVTKQPSIMENIARAMAPTPVDSDGYAKCQGCGSAFVPPSYERSAKRCERCQDL